MLNLVIPINKSAHAANSMAMDNQDMFDIFVLFCQNRMDFKASYPYQLTNTQIAMLIRAN
jgi:hypothetical protein